MFRGVSRTRLRPSTGPPELYGEICSGRTGGLPFSRFWLISCAIRDDHFAQSDLSRPTAISQSAP